MKNTSFIVIGAALILLLILWKPKKETETESDMTDENGIPFPKVFWKVNTNQPLETAVLEFVKKKEGGLSKDKTDPAAVNPVPDGSGYHTNKGVTWATFNVLGNSLGYNGNDTKLFYEMPDNIWTKIIKRRYFQPFENLTTSKVCNYYVGTWAWGSGVTGAKNLLTKIGATSATLNDKIRTEGELKTLVYLVKERMDFYKRLVNQKKELEKYLNGWLYVAESYYYNFKNYIK